MLNFLKTGNSLNGVSIGTDLSDLEASLGEPTERVGDDQNGYVYYGYYRYGYRQNKITELSIEFPLIEKPIILENVEYIKYDISLFEDFSLDQNSQLHDIIRLLNYLQLDWTAKNEIDKDHFVLRVKDSVGVISDLQDGSIVRISIMKDYLQL